MKHLSNNATETSVPAGCRGQAQQCVGSINSFTITRIFSTHVTKHTSLHFDNNQCLRLDVPKLVQDKSVANFACSNRRA